MIQLSLKKEYNFLPANIRKKMWQLVQGNLPIRDFELWTYSDLELEQVLSEDSYLALLMTNYKYEEEMLGRVLNLV